VACYSGCGYKDDESIIALLSKLAIDPTAVPHFTLQNGLLRYKNRIWLCTNKDLQLKIIQACHDSPVGGHSGVPVTYMRLKKMFSWRGMKSDVHKYVKSCMACQRAKPDRGRLPGLLQPLPVPDSAWPVLSLDFVEGLPTSGQVICVLMVIDYFTKYGHFIPLHHPFTAHTIANVFLANVYKLHGMPSAIVPDHDRVFTSAFWKELFKLAGVELHMSSSYHPQSDGQTEWLNQTMETFLRCFVNACPAKCSSWLSLAEYWYNNTPHSAIGTTPFEALYVYSPKNFGISVADSVAIPELSVWLQDRKVMTELIKQHLHRSRERMKKQADKHRSERQFAVGDFVFVKLQPYIQKSLAPRSNKKLSYKYFSPFPVLERIGMVAYKLQLPAHSSVHPVFHVSQLKHAVTDRDQVSPTFPTDVVLPRVPELILQTKSSPNGRSSNKLFLVKWSGWPDTMVTWEDAEDVKRRFSRAPAWGQAVSQEGGDVSNTDAATTGPRLSRPRKPNTRVSGPEWVNMLACMQ